MNQNSIETEPAILLIQKQDSPRQIVDLIGQDGCDLSTADPSEDLAGLLQMHQPDLVIIDDSTAATLCQQVKALPVGEQIACLVITENQDEARLEALFAAGADDCLPWPSNPTLLRQRLRMLLDWRHTRLQLRRGEERYRSIAQLAADYAYEVTVDPAGGIHSQWITETVHKVVGYDPDELNGTDTWRALIYPEDADLVAERFKQLMTGQESTHEFRICHKDGSILWLQDHALPIIDPQQERVVRIYGVGRNITEQKLTRQALRNSQETLELALEAGEIGIWDWDMVNNSTYFSPGYLRMLGYVPEDVENNFDSWATRIHPDDLPRVQEKLQQHIEQGLAYEVEHRLRTKNGDWRWIQARGRIVERDSHGKPLRMAGIHRDIQDTRTIRDALELSEERHRVISETISDYAYAYKVTDEGSLVKEWSTQAFHDITGYTFEEMDQNGWERLIHPDDKEISARRFLRLMQGEVDISEFRIITKSGEVRWLRDHGYPVTDPETGRIVHIYGAAQDITQRKHDEEKLREQAIQLESRNEELDAFAYTVAHDLKNPIASMMGFASLIQTYLPRMSEEEILDHVNLIMESGYKLKSIINALLMLAGVSKMEQAEISTLDMGAIVGESLRRLQSLIDESGAEINLPESWPSAQGYGPWVEEIWTNYISNAIKYGGVPPKISLGATVVNRKRVRFWVRDNGQGLTREEQIRVFTPFTRLNQVKVEGHGLGLSVVQRIVERLGGEVGVESEPGKGSTFNFTLPASTRR